MLDFGDRLATFGPDDRLVLGLAGWTEYPYSQTNYAAATAGVPLRPPVLERQRDDGSWEVIEADPGYPAGLPRLTLLDLTGQADRPPLRAPPADEHGDLLGSGVPRRRRARRRPPRGDPPRRPRRPGRARLHEGDFPRWPPPLDLRLRLHRPRPPGADVGPVDPARRRGTSVTRRRRPPLPRRPRRRGAPGVRRPEPPPLAGRLDPLLRPSRLGILQGRRPLHRLQRPDRPVALEGDGGLSVRPRRGAADRPGLPALPPDVPDPLLGAIRERIPHRVVSCCEKPPIGL